MNHDAIATLVYRYCRALDRLDADLLRSVFHPGAEIDMGAIYRGGVDGFIDVAMGFMGSMESTRHCVSNLLVEGDKVEAYVDAWHLLPGPTELIVRARYLQTVTEHNGAMAIARHAEVIDFGTQRPVNTGWFAGEIGLPRGCRGRDDPSYAAA
ncbi:MAG: nuclear transport factor 2 family protein [Sphingomonadaceae bacterium]|nr:nuclear transport factor 2 family protein [Sphingomonadaceae bacterium]